MEVEDRLRELEDREAIRELKYEYARGIDDRAWEGWVDLFVEDAHCEYEGWGTVEGREGLRAFADTLAETFEYTAHVMHHPVVEVEGDRATGRWYLTLHYALRDGPAGWRQGRYEDALRRVGGEWKFSEVSHEMCARKTFEYEVVDDPDFGRLVEYGDPV